MFRKSKRETTPIFQLCCEQGIIDFTGTETFTMEPKVANLLRELKSTPF